MPKDARPYRTPVAKAMAFPNKVVKEKLKTTGMRAILKIRQQGGSQRERKNKSQPIISYTYSREKTHFSVQQLTKG